MKFKFLFFQGWQVVYLLMGIVGVIWVAIWLLVITERPEVSQTTFQAYAKVSDWQLQSNTAMRQRERRLILDSVPRPKPTVRNSLQINQTSRNDGMPRATIRACFLNLPVCWLCCL